MTQNAVMDTLQVTVLVLVAAGATVVVRTRDRVRLVLVLSVYGMLLAILFFAFQAPDVALSELTVGAVALPLILLLAIAKVRKPQMRPTEVDSADPRQRLWLFAFAAAGLVACYLWAFAGLPGFGNYPGPYGPAILKHAIAQTNATGVVSAINFDYRGFDTVGEEFILFTAAAGMSVVLRRLRGEREERSRVPSSRPPRNRQPPADEQRRPGRDAAARRPDVPSSAGGWPRTPRPTRPAASRAA